MKTDYSQYILPIGAIILIAGVLKRFGLLKDTQQEKTEQQQLFSNYFSPNYLQQLYKQGGKTALMTQAKANEVAERIYRSKGFFNDDEGMLYSAIKAFKYKSQVSQVAGVFYVKYKKDLAQYLQSFLNDKELQSVFDYTDNLPTGKL
jgi:hypothetical protein